jgi:hypothetical protein
MKATAHRLAAHLALVSDETFQRVLGLISRELDDHCEHDDTYQGSWFTNLIDRSTWWVHLERKRIRAGLTPSQRGETVPWA